MANTHIHETSSQKKPSFSFALFGIIGILLLIVCVSVILVFFPKKNNHPTNEPTSSSNPNSTPPLVTDEYDKWQTYTNTAYSYRIQYPSSWEVVEATQRVDMNPAWIGEFLVQEANEVQKVNFLETDPSYYQGRFEVRVLSNPNDYTLDEWASQFNIPLQAAPDTNLAQIVGDAYLDEEPAKQFEINTLVVPGEIGIVSMHNNFVYFIRFDDWEHVDADTEKYYMASKRNEINTQILSTFEFIDANDSAITPSASCHDISRSRLPNTGMTFLESYCIGNYCSPETNRNACESVDVVSVNNGRLNESWSQDGIGDCIWVQTQSKLNQCHIKYK